MNLILKAICVLAAIMILPQSVVASIVINEMELNPPDDGVDWVEIYNSGNDGVDIGGWTAKLTDGSWIGEFPPVPSGTTIPANGFYVFSGLSTWNHENGGYASLYTASGELVDKTADREDALDNDFTYGRHPDGYDTDKDGDWGLGSATKGESNTR